MHHPVHDKGGPGHVSRILHKGNNEKEDQNVGQEHYYAPHSSDHPVDQKIVHHPIRQQSRESAPQPVDPRLDPAHGVLTKRKSGMKHAEQDQHKNQESEVLMGQHPVNFLCPRQRTVLRSLFIGLFEGTGNKCIPGIRNERLCILPEQAIQAVHFIRDNRSYVLKTRQLSEDMHAVIVTLQRPHCVIPEVLTRKLLLVLFQLLFDPADRLLQLLAVVDMCMPDHRFAVLIHLYNAVEQAVDPFAPPADGGHDRDPDQVPQLCNIQLVATRLQVVVHIQRDDHLHPHIDQLGGEVHVPFGVPGIDNIHDDIGTGVVEKIPDDHLIF